MNTNDFIYDAKMFSERLDNLRREENKYTLKTLSEKITEKTGVYISPAQLGKYENADKPERINTNNLLAIAKFYGVSPEYLLGISDSKKNNYTYQMTANKFSVSDKSMDVLSKLSNSKKMNSSSKFKLDLINFIIEDKFFINNLSDELISYYKAIDNKLKIKDEFKEQYGVSILDITKNTLVKTFEKFIDDSYENLYKANQPKKNYLFDMPKDKKSKKEKR